MVSCLALSGGLVIIYPHDYRKKSPPAFDNTNMKPRCCLVFSGDGSFPSGKGYSFSNTASSHASSYFTGASFVNSSSIVLKGETVFADNTAYFAGKTVKMNSSI